MIAEDEDHKDCLEIYRQKGLIEQQATFGCDSPILNANTTAIFSTVFNRTKFETTKDHRVSFEYNVTVIEAGTTVEIQAVKCNGISECWNGVDELIDCGFSTFETMIIGNLCFLFS